MDHKLQANLHHLLLELQDSTKYDSICFMLQDLHNRQSKCLMAWKTASGGSTPQIAVVRAYLVKTYGKEVDMPELELIP